MCKLRRITHKINIKPDFIRFVIDSPEFAHRKKSTKIIINSYNVVGISFLILVLTYSSYVFDLSHETFNTKSGVLVSSLTLNFKGNAFRKNQAFSVVLVYYKWGVQYVFFMFKMP